MIALMTYWSVPTRLRVMHRTELCLWALAAKLARQHFGRLVLSTDDAGARLLVEHLGMEVDEVRLDLSGFEPGLPRAWALGKIESYRRCAERGEAFCHVDGDVVLWRPLPPALTQAALFAQYDERELSAYYPLDRIAPRFPALPNPVAALVQARVVRGYNAGILGGTDCEFFARFAHASLAAARHPANAGANRLNGTVVSIFLEQYFFGAFADGRAVATLLAPPQLAGDAMRASAVEAGFTHFLGNSKRNRRYAARIFARTEQELPGTLDRVRSLAAI